MKGYVDRYVEQNVESDPSEKEEKIEQAGMNVKDVGCRKEHNDQMKNEIKKRDEKYE